jgi:uncharacterized protein YxjI
MDHLVAARRLTVVQKKEWGEILSGFEGANRYKILDDQGNELYSAAETGGSLLARWFLRALRPFTIEVVRDAKPVLRVQRPFRFYFHEASIEDANGRPLGTIRREFALLNRAYTICDATGAPRLVLHGPLFRPWTFLIRNGPQSSAAPLVHGEGKIAKRWSGLLKETFTDSDHFGIEFPDGLDAAHKALLLGVVFLIDFVHFENRGR